MAEIGKIQGLDGVRKALKRLPKELQKRELSRALTPGASLIRKTAVALAPSSGEAYTRQLRGKTWQKPANNLKDSIKVRSEKKKYLRDGARKRVGVLFSKRDPNVGAWYWRFVEFGTAKQSAQPFLTPAFEQQKYAAAALIHKALLKGVRRQAARVKAR